MQFGFEPASNQLRTSQRNGIWLLRACLHDRTHNSSLNTTHCPPTLASSLMNILPSLAKFRPSPKLAITILDSVVAYLDSTACTIATSGVHSKLDYCNALYYNLPKSQITRLRQIQNSLARAVFKAPKPVTSLLSYAVFIGSK